MNVLSVVSIVFFLFSLVLLFKTKNRIKEQGIRNTILKKEVEKIIQNPLLLSNELNITSNEQIEQNRKDQDLIEARKRRDLKRIINTI